MCTAVAIQGEHFFFGRNMDLERHFGERVVAVPHRFVFDLRFCAPLQAHYAMLGTATVINGYPLFADACNEHGLCMAGLNFPNNAHYFAEAREGKRALAPFELFPYLLGSCRSIDEARDLLFDVILVDVPFCQTLPNAPMHWLLADQGGALVIEQTCEGLQIYDDPVGVLTNNPPFPIQLGSLSRYTGLTKHYINENSFSHLMQADGLGQGALGLPGDPSSASRFVRAAWIRENMTHYTDAERERAQAFHLLNAVSMPHGCVLDGEGKAHYTTYSCIMDGTTGEYFRKRYFDSSIEAFGLQNCDLDAERLLMLSDV